jgi:hypothetical protein
MRTNIDIDDTLMAEAQKASDHTTKKQTVGRSASLDGEAAAAAARRFGFRQVQLARQSCPEPQRPTRGVIVVNRSVWSDFLRGCSVPECRSLAGAARQSRRRSARARHVH